MYMAGGTCWSTKRRMKPFWATGTSTRRQPTVKRCLEGEATVHGPRPVSLCQTPSGMGQRTCKAHVTSACRLTQLRGMLLNAERLVSNKSMFDERVTATQGSNGSLPRGGLRHVSVAHGSWWQAEGTQEATDGAARNLNGMRMVV